MSVTLDHFMWAGPDLDGLINEFEKLSGVRATKGGRHRGKGTRNAIVRLDKSAYIELIAPDEEQRAEDFLGTLFGSLAKPEVMLFFVRSNDLAAARNTYEIWGIESRLIAMERQSPAGDLLSWQILVPSLARFGAAIPLFIDWMNSPHPAAAKEECHLLELNVHSPANDELRRLYGDLHVELNVSYAASAGVEVRIKGARGTFELRSGSSYPRLSEWQPG